MSDIIFEGFFLIDPETKEKTHIHGLLENIPFHQHITTRFRPDDPHKIAYGLMVMFPVDGYQNDGKNEAIHVDVFHAAVFSKTDSYIWLMDTDIITNALFTLQNPHITLSFADGAAPKDSGKLYFDRIHEWPSYIPKCVYAIYGGFDGEKVIFEKPHENLST